MTTTTARLRLTAVAGATLLIVILTFSASRAAFSGTTDNPDNQWASGSVTLVDSDAGVPMFDNLTNLVPGDSATNCIEVTYQGSVNAEIRLHGAATGGTGLEAFLDLTVVRGTGTCAAFTADSTFWDAGDGDLGDFLSTAANYSSGVDAWIVNGGAPDDTVPYRFTATLQDNNGAQGLDTTVTFTWEGQNT